MIVIGIHLAQGLESVTEEHEEEGSHQIVHPLNVTRCWMTYGANEEDPFKNLLNTTLLKKANHGAHSGNVNVDLAIGILAISLVSCREIQVYVTLVFFLFPLHDLGLSGRISGQISA